MSVEKLKIIDIGHSNYNLEQAISVLEATVSQSIFEGKIKAIKVITGHGSGILRKSVKTWLHEQDGRFQAIILGEDYSLFNKEATDMRADCQLISDQDFDRGNKAIIYIWLW